MREITARLHAANPAVGAGQARKEKESDSEQELQQVQEQIGIASRTHLSCPTRTAFHSVVLRSSLSLGTSSQPTPGIFYWAAGEGAVAGGDCDRRHHVRL